MKKITLATLLSLSIASSEVINKESFLLMEKTIKELVVHIQELQKEVDTLKARNSLSIKDKEHISTLDVTNKIPKSYEKINEIIDFKFGSIMVKTWKANARISPSLDAKISKVFEAGQTIEIDTNYKNDKWYRLKDGLYMAKVVAHLYDKKRFVNATTIRDTNLKRVPSNLNIDTVAEYKKGKEVNLYKDIVADYWHITDDSKFIRNKDVVIN